MTKLSCVPEPRPDPGILDFDVAMMRLALEEALLAECEGEVPVGAVVVMGPNVVSRARNRREQRQDPTAHAEILAIRSAAESLGHWRLLDASLYVTLEPCPMCAGALVNARVKRLIFGASDPKAGAVGSLYQIPQDFRLNHRLDVTSGVLASEAQVMLQTFFRKRRRV